MIEEETDMGTVLVPPKDPEQFRMVAPELESLYDFEFVALMSKDSTNMTPNDWSAIAEAVYSRRHDGFDGFVIAHGTDTMHFSASAVAFALGKNLNFPVVFTGAQTIPGVPHGDARINLLRAFKACTTSLAEVVIAFGDYLFRGCRAQKKDERRFDAFESPAFFPLGNVTEEIILSPNTRLRKKDCGDIELRNTFASHIVQVSLIPGLEPILFEPVLHSGMCEGVILQSFGAGNVPNENGFSFSGFIAAATKRGIPVIITSQFPANATLHTKYKPGRDAVNVGAIPTANMTASCAAAKFRWVIAQVKELFSGADAKTRLNEVRRMMNTVYVGEMDVPMEDRD
jgi:L-asparaginase